MCGRFSLTMPPGALAEKFFIDEIFFEYVPDADFSPGKFIPMLISDNKRRILSSALWGFLPPWEQNKSRALINARAETVHKKPSFKKAFTAGRCIIPATGFYEWKKEGNARIKYLIQVQGKEVFALAGICEEHSLPDGKSELRCAVLTKEAAGEMVAIHNRMPVIISSEEELAWLETGNNADAIKILSAPIFNETLSIKETDFLPA